MKQKKPGIFEVFKMYAKYLQVDAGDTDDMFKPILDQIKNDPEMSPYFDRCKKLLTEESLATLWTENLREPWTTIIHSDFWVNNVMFHRNPKGKIDSVKFVDFQIYVYGSPTRDLLFFLYSSLAKDLAEDQVEDLMDLYYESLVNMVNKMGCNVDALTKEDFKKKLAEDAVPEFVHLCFMIKVLTLDTKEINDFNYDKIETVMMNYAGSQLFTDRLRNVVLCFVKRNWI